MMKIGHHFFLLWILLLPAGQIAAAESGVARPALWFEKEIYMFTEVESGQKITAFFPFANYGEGELIITDVKVTCDCTDAYASPDRLPPGESGVIVVVLDTSHRDGNLDKTAIIFSNDPDRPEVTLHIQGKAYLPLTIKPSPLFVDDLAVDKPAVADIVLLNTGKRPLSVLSLAASEKDLAWAITDRDHAPATLPYALAVQDVLRVRLTLTPTSDVKKTIYRQLAVTVDPAAKTPIILKIQGMFPQEEKEVK